MPMETEDVLQLKSETPSGAEGNEPCGSRGRPAEVNSSPSMDDEEGLIRDDLDQREGKVENEGRVCTLDPDLDKDLTGEVSTAQMNVELIESIEASESSQVLVGNGFAAFEDHHQKMTHVRDGNCILILLLVCSFVCL